MHFIQIERIFGGESHSCYIRIEDITRVENIANGRTLIVTPIEDFVIDGENASKLVKTICLATEGKVMSFAT